MDNRIIKAGGVTGAEVTDEMLAKINAYTIKPLAAEEVYVFRIAMCDNEVDRDEEAFTTGALGQLAELFRGKTVISDHRWQAERQVARIFDTEVEAMEGTAKTGEPAARLVAYCYTLRNETNRDLIAEIDAGIKREVSVGCAVATCECSVCGVNRRNVWCEHVPGKSYEGAACFIRLKDAVDAYELSFVAVPAQREAGVIKSYGAEKPAEAPDPAEEPGEIKAKREALERRQKLNEDYTFAIKI